MSADPIVRLAHLRIIAASRELETELASIRNAGPSLEILRRLRERAAESLAALAIIDPEEPAAIRALQNEVKKYDEWVAWLREIISEGIAYDREIDQDERDDMLDLLLGTSEGQKQARELGLVVDHPDDA